MMSEFPEVSSVISEETLPQENLYYARAPIVEALLEIRIAPHPQHDLASLEELAGALKTAYPHQEQMMRVEVAAQFGPPVEANATHSYDGFRCVSHDARQAVMLGLDAFTFSRFKPYENWDDFSKQARELWTQYRDTFQIEDLTGWSLRYINRLDLPLGADLKEYLRTAPEISPVLPQQVADYYLHLNLPQPEPDVALIIRQGTVPTAQPELASIVLDIWLSVTRSLHCPASKNQTDDDELWRQLAQLRKRKNEVFEACLTGQMKERIL